MRTCPACGEDKDPTDFYEGKRNCKECECATRRIRYRSNYSTVQEALDDFRATGRYKAGLNKRELRQMVRAAEAIRDVQRWQVEKIRPRPTTAEELAYKWYPVPDLPTWTNQHGLVLLHPVARKAEQQQRKILLAAINEALVRGWFSRNAYGRGVV